MKKIILLSSVVLLTAIFVSSCVRNAPVNYDENYWLTQERGDVVYSDPYCSYYVVETNYGYTIIRTWTNADRPYEGSLVYGHFGNYGTRDFYNYSGRYLVRGEVVEYDLSYVDAQYAIEYYCPYAKAGKIKQSENFSNKAKRVTSTTEQPSTK